MGTTADDPGMIAHLRLMLRMAGTRPAGWLIATVSMSILLALMDMAGVAAMVPLTQLATGTAEGSPAIAAIEDLFGTSDPAILIPLVACVIAVLFVVKSVATIAFKWWLIGRTSRISALAATELMRRYLLAPYADHRARQMSEVYRNINDSTAQAASVLLAVLSLITDLLLLTGIVVVLAITAPWITLLTVVLFAAFIFGLQRALRAKQAEVGEELAEASLEAWNYLRPGLDGFREARLTSSAQQFVDGYRRARLRRANAGRLLAVIGEAPRHALEIGFILAIAGIATILFNSGTPGQAVTVLGVFAAASLRGLPTLNKVAAGIATIRANRAGMRIVSAAVDELDHGRVHREEPGDVPYRGDITLRSVSFTYPDTEAAVLDDVSLTIAENTTVAFVGSSGAGKTTLLDLILGLLEPTSGTIECGGRSIADDPATWYSTLSVVPQDVFLINDTVRANVAFGVPPDQIDDDRVWEALTLAQLSDVIHHMPAQLDTLVGERGTRLSGGQRQRLGLARALYRRPSLLVLDEATSALDNETEHEITSTLAALEGDLTIIIVAHRLSTVRRAGTLLFMADGRIEAEGTFSELRERSPGFARLVSIGELN